MSDSPDSRNRRGGCRRKAWLALLACGVLLLGLAACILVPAISRLRMVAELRAAAAPAEINIGAGGAWLDATDELVALKMGQSNSPAWAREAGDWYWTLSSSVILQMFAGPVRWVDLRGRPDDGAAFYSVLVKLPDLRIFSVMDVSAFAPGEKARLFENLPRLARLELLQWRSLTGPGMVDGELDLLRQIPRLSALEISRSSITPQALEQFMEMPGLNRVAIRDQLTAFPNEDLARLRAKFPGVIIELDFLKPNPFEAMHQ